MFIQSKKSICLFDKYKLAIPTKLECYMDGISGQRVLFISDREKTFNVSFEENMVPMDMLPEIWGNVQTVSYQCSRGDKYIHLRRKNFGRIVCAFFHIELRDLGSKTLCLPGQIVVDADYKWSEGIEPVLLDLLDGLTA